MSNKSDIKISARGESLTDQRREPHLDVTGTINISSPDSVRVEVWNILNALFPEQLGKSGRVLHDAFVHFERLYSGKQPGYAACDTWYHDAQHSLAATLAFARIASGHEQSARFANKLGAERILVGIITTLFHDAGYIRRLSDTKVENGAEFTLTHVKRSAEYLSDYLPTVGLGHWAPLVEKLIHFTGFEIELDAIQVANSKDRLMGYILGTADLLAQMADAVYLEKCWHYLFKEFQICGLAAVEADNADDAATTNENVLYASPVELMLKTPAFNSMVWEERLDGRFESCYRLVEEYFDGANPYLEAVNANMQRLDSIIDADDFAALEAAKPQIIGAEQLTESQESAQRARVAAAA